MKEALLFRPQSRKDGPLMEYDYIKPFFRVHDGYLFRNVKFDSYSTSIVSFTGVFPSGYEVVEKPANFGREDDETEGDSDDR